MEVIKTIHGSDLVPTSSPDIEMTVDVLEAEEVTFTLASNKIYKGNRKASFLSPMFSSDSRSKTLLIL